MFSPGTSPGVPETVVQVVDTVVMEMFSKCLDGKPYDDGGNDDDHRDDDDDWKVEEVTAISIFEAGSSLLDIRHYVTLDHF